MYTTNEQYVNLLLDSLRFLTLLLDFVLRFSRSRRSSSLLWASLLGGWLRFRWKKPHYELEKRRFKICIHSRIARLVYNPNAV